MTEELPDGWATATIPELICSDGIYTDGDWVESKDQDPNGKVRLIQLADIGDGKFIDKSSRFLNSKKAEELNCTFLDKNDVLVARMPDPLGRACLFPLEEQNLYVTVVDVCAVRVRPELIDPKYLMYLINSPNSRNKIEQYKTGSTRKRISRGNLSKIEFPIPPANEQKRILAKIEELFSELDKGVENLMLAREQLKVYRQAILKHAFEGKLTADWRKENKDRLEDVSECLKSLVPPQQPRGGRAASKSVIEGRAAISVNQPNKIAPEGWQWVSLLRVARQETGHTPSRKFSHYWEGGKIPWIGIADARIHHCKTINETIQKPTNEGLKNSSARLLPKHTVCLSRTASVGYVCVMGQEMATSQDFATWTCTELLDPYFLMYALIAEGDHIRKFGKGTTHTTIYFPEIRALNICLPPISEQKEVVAEIEKQFSMIEEVEADIKYQLEKANTLRQSILKQAFSGRLVPQDTNDEPAYVLLERIKAEKVKNGKTKKGKAA